MTLLAAASVVLRLAGRVSSTLVLGSRLVGVSAQTVVQLALWSVLRTVHPSVVETAVAACDLAVLAVGVVEVGHAPSVLLVLVVVSIGRPMLGGRDGLGVWCRSTVVEVDLGPVDTVGTWLSKLLLPEAALPSSAPHADHPDEENQHDDEKHRSGNATGDVGKLRLFLAVLPVEGSGALAIWLSLLLHASAVVHAIVEAVVDAATNGAVALVSLLARALVPPDVQPAVRLEQAVGVLVAQLLLGARVGALLPRSGSNVSNDSDVVGACVGRALDALRLLLLWLEGADWTSLALVVGGVQELAGNTDWHAAVCLRGGAWSQGGSTRLTILTAAVQTLGPVCAYGASLTLSGEAQLLSVWTVVAALVL